MPADTIQLPQALRAWQPLVAFMTREALLIAYAVLVTAWLVWIDNRSLRLWLRLKFWGPLEIEFPEEANLINKVAEPYKQYQWLAVRDDPKINLNLAIICISIHNKSRSTIDDVKVIVSYGGRPLESMNLSLPTWPHNTSYSIDPGGRLFFKLGEYAFDSMVPAAPIMVDDAKYIEGLKKISKPMALIITGRDNRKSGLLKNNGQYLYLQILARNTAPLYARFIVTLKEDHTFIHLKDTSRSEWDIIQDRPKKHSGNRSRANIVPKR